MAFNQHTTPTALDQLIRRAKNESSVHTFSRSFDSDPSKVTTVTKLFRSSEHPSVRMGALANPELATQFLFVLAGKIFPLTRPCITSEDGNAMYISSMLDELGECIPILVPAEGFTGWFTSIVPAKDANDSACHRTSSPRTPSRANHQLPELTTARQAVWIGSTLDRTPQLWISGSRRCRWFCPSQGAYLSQRTHGRLACQTQK